MVVSCNQTGENMEQVQGVTQDDLDRGNFQIVMRSNAVGWLTKDKIILPGRDHPIKSELTIATCQVDKPLKFNYLDSNNVITVVSPSSVVKEIIRYDI